jgi:hypothetical protein
MAANLNSPFPPSDLPFIDAGGRVNRVWLDFLVSLFRRTGSTTGGDLTGLTLIVEQHTEHLNEIDREIADLQLLVESDPFSAAMAAILSRMATLELMVATLPVSALVPRMKLQLPDPVAPAARAAQILPEPVTPTARPANDDLRKLIEAQT